MSIRKEGGPAALVASPADTSLILNCSRDIVYELIRSGELDSYLDGRSRKIVVASIEAYVARRLKAAKQFERARYPARRADGKIVQAGIGAKQSVTAS